jgi:dephospho-CoA kinase
MIIIGITGYKGSGKDTIASIFVDHGYVRYGFADPIKSMMYDIFGFTYDELHDHVLKETINDKWGITPRKLMQLIGTDMFRKLWRDDVWNLLLETKLQKKGVDYVISDLRFNNEAKLLKKYDAHIVQVIRPGQIMNDQHESNEPIDASFIDKVIINDGSVDDLTEKVKIWLKWC